MRGKQKILFVRHERARITPAGAGKTRTDDGSPTQAQDHPRRCGENHCIIPHSTVTLGSPPQVRGKLAKILKQNGVDRITPAGAGKTFRSFASSSVSWDHPRGCGENRSRIIGHSSVKGSPPRMRGKLFPCFAIICGVRITPADAGKTSRYAAPAAKT